MIEEVPIDPRNTISSNSGHRIRVVFFATQLYALACGREAGYGGAETEMWSVARGLSCELEYDVRVLTLTNEIQSPKHLDGVALYPVPDSPNLTWEDSWLTRRRAVLNYYTQLYKSLRQQKADIYYTKLASAEACIVYLVSRAAGSRFVFRIEHDWETNFDDLTNNIFRGRSSYARLFVFCLRRADLVIAQTAKQVAELSANFGVNAEIIPNGHVIPPDEAVAHDPDERTNVLWVGRAHPMKRPALFLDLAEQFSNFRFVMIMAASAEHPDLFQAVQQRALTLPNVDFIPGVAAGKLNSYYRTARLFVLTSEAEGFSNVIIEAMKNGSPVLTFDHNPNDLLSTFTGTQQLVPQPGFCTYNSMTAATVIVKELLTDNNFWTQCHNHLRVLIVNNFGLEKILFIYKRHFQSMAATNEN